MTLDFTSDGHAHCLYDEAIDLHALGRLQMRRASHIEFNEETQQWEVRLVDSKEMVFEDASRQRCLMWERKHLINRNGSICGCRLDLLASLHSAPPVSRVA